MASSKGLASNDDVGRLLRGVSAVHPYVQFQRPLYAVIIFTVPKLLRRKLKTV